MKKQIYNQKKGFAIFASLMLAAVVTAVAYGISAIGAKELRFARGGIESHNAYIAAEIGLECAQNYLFKADSDFNFDGGSEADINDEKIEIYCNNQNSKFNAIKNYNGVSGKGTVSFSFDIDGSIRSCADVLLTRTYKYGGELASTVIESEGYNTACDSITDNTSQRAIRILY